MREVVGDVVVMCKETTPLPDLHKLAAIWCEPEEPRHPLAGVRWALRQADGRAVIVCAEDMPLVTVDVLRAVLGAAAGDVAAVVPRAGGRLQPLLAYYAPAVLPALDAMDPGEAATAVVERLEPVVVDIDDADAFFNVNAPEDVLRASALRAERGAAAASRT
jgi:molybdopterin-guanine dinucleotide biosynthesis protein A